MLLGGQRSSQVVNGPARDVLGLHRESLDSDFEATPRTNTAGGHSEWGGRGVRAESHGGHDYVGLVSSRISAISPKRAGIRVPQAWLTNSKKGPFEQRNHERQ